MIKRTLRAVLSPFNRLMLRSLSVADAWQRFPYPVPLERYGKGALHDFPWYFEGTSCVDVASIDAIKQWLLDCTYTRDADLFREDDFWQHPLTFEKIRQGDCEDFALWTWRKLVRLGYGAELVVGRHAGEGSAPVGHAWVLFNDHNRRLLFDPVHPSDERMIVPLHEARDDYVPEASVDHRFRRYAYAGYGRYRAGADAQSRANAVPVTA